MRWKTRGGETTLGKFATDDVFAEFWDPFWRIFTLAGDVTSSTLAVSPEMLYKIFKA